MNKTNKKIVIAFGTRPEAIKMCPVVRYLKDKKDIDVRVVFTGQHRELADGALNLFDVSPDYDMNIMRPAQSLFDVTQNILGGIRDILCQEQPDTVMVHGDTTTAFAVALAAFYMNIPVAHVEAGLRSYNMNEPFPEEFNRRAVTLIASLHFAPTQRAAENLMNEGVPLANICVTGNTVIDAMKYTVSDKYVSPYIKKDGVERLIFLTAHRRESLDGGLENMLLAVKDITKKYGDVRVLYPVHPNPKIKSVAERILGGCERVTMCPPLDVVDCHNIMAQSYLLLTDSGGIQEEAAALGVPALVMRNITERPEGILAGVAKLAGTDRYQITATVSELLDNPLLHSEMRSAPNPYGDGNACQRIWERLKKVTEGNEY